MALIQGIVCLPCALIRKLPFLHHYACLATAHTVAKPAYNTAYAMACVVVCSIAHYAASA